MRFRIFSSFVFVRCELILYIFRPKKNVKLFKSDQRIPIKSGNAEYALREKIPGENRAFRKSCRREYATFVPSWSVSGAGL